MKVFRRLFYTVISVFIFAVQHTFTAVMVICGIFDVSFNSGKKIRSCVAVWGTGILRIMGKKLRIHGMDNIQKGKNYILITNHASLYDIPAVSSFYPRISWLGRAYLTKIPLFGRVLEATDYIPIKPGDIKETKKVIELLIQKSESLTVVIFPEGTRTLDGKLQRFRKGFLHLLKGSDLDILPVTLNGFYSLKPKKRFYIDLKPQLEVIIHKPVKKEELIEKSDNEILDQMKRIIESAYRCL